MFRLVARIALIVAAAALVACATRDTPPENPQAVVKERVAIMKSFGAALGAAGAFAQGKGTADAAKTKLAAARAGAPKLAGLFPRGTALGDKGVTDSRALSTIFANRSDFDTKRTALEDALAALDGGLAAKSKADVAKQTQAVKNACASCHTRYRTPNET